MVRTATITTLVLLLGCGQRITPLDAHDASLPDRTRRLVSESEDAVVVARADHRSRQRDVQEVERWAEALLEQTDWSAAGLDVSVQRFSAARGELAQTRLAHAEAALELAQAKLDLVHAEQAVHLDRANYELEPLRQRVEQVRNEVAEARKRARTAHVKSEEAASAWWEAYGKRARAKGSPDTYWTAGAAPLAAPAPKSKKRAVAGDAKKLANH